MATISLYTKAPLNFLPSLWTTDDIRLILTNGTVSQVTNQDVFDFANDITDEFATAGGYTAGGVALAGKTITQDNATNRQLFDANDAIWTSVTLTNIRYGVALDNTPATSATKPLIGYVDLVSNQNPAGVNFEIRWSTSPSAVWYTQV